MWKCVWWVWRMRENLLKVETYFFLLYFKHRKLITEMSLSRSSKVSSTVFPHLISAATHVTVTSTWEVHGSLKLYTGLNYVLCKTEDELSILTSRIRFLVLCVEGQWLSATHLTYNRVLVNTYCISK